jgi:hypothetical protein
MSHLISKERLHLLLHLLLASLLLHLLLLQRGSR